MIYFQESRFFKQSPGSKGPYFCPCPLASFPLPISEISSFFHFAEHHRLPFSSHVKGENGKQAIALRGNFSPKWHNNSQSAPNPKGRKDRLN